MDINEELNKSEEQMEMMMMMQMNKIPEFCQAYNDVVEALEPPPSEFNSAATSSHHPTSSSFSTLSPNTISFTNNNNNTNTNPIQESFLSNSNSNMDFGRWRSSDEMNIFSTNPNSQNKKNSMVAMREMIFRIAAMQPIHIDPESIKPPKRRNVKISKDPQSVAARHRRERISERIRILQRLVPGGTKMDTASMLDEAIHYVKFLKTQVQSLERASVNRPTTTGIGFPVAMSSGNCYLPSVTKAFQPPHHHHHKNVQHFGDA